MATVILSRGALSIVAKEYYQKLDKAQEKLFAYIYHLDKGDEEQAKQAFEAGAYCIVVGGAITRPQEIASRFLSELR